MYLWAVQFPSNEYKVVAPDVAQAVTAALKAAERRGSCFAAADVIKVERGEAVDA